MSEEQTSGAEGTAHTAFTRGSTMRHIVATTAYGAVGIMTLFVVDLVDLFFIGLLGELELAAAVGYAGTILFFTFSLGIGLGIAMATVVARSVGAGELEEAKRAVAHNALAILVVTIPIAALAWALVPTLVALIGAEGKTAVFAAHYLRIILPAMPCLALAIAGGGVLRAVARPRLAMMATVSGGLVNAVLDPLLIFGLDLGLTGAALATVASQIAVLLVSWRGVILDAGMLGRPARGHLASDLRRFAGIAAPAVTTNLATPVGNAIVISAMARHGPEVVAGFAIVGRLIPVAFGAVFALTGAVGPIIGQNVGALLFPRVRRTLLDALTFTAITVLLAATVLFLANDWIAAAFRASPSAREILTAFTHGVTLLFVFQGALFIANAAFNNLGRPLWSTLSNWARATLGTLPLVWLGDRLFGAPGVLWGQAFGGVIFGTLAFAVALKLAGRGGALRPERPQPFFRLPVQAMTSVRGWIPSPGSLRRRHRE